MTSRALVGIGFASLVMIAGCGAIADDSGSGAAATTQDGGTASGTGVAPPDGAPGKCCPPSIGGCAVLGGYKANGDCDKSGPCDNMCEQRIVDDVHGCKKLEYKTPPVQTTYAGPESCSDPIFNGAGLPGNGPGSAKPTCDAPAVTNDPRCPPQYAWSMCHGTACPAIGLSCAYPNSGDGPMADGCYATAMMWCVPEGGLPDTFDAGADASADADASTPGTWICAQ